MRGVLQISRLARQGRWANSVFQWLFGKVYSRRHDLQLQVPPWIGETLFGFQDARPNRYLRPFQEKEVHGVDDTIIPHLPQPLRDVDAVGYFQYHTSFFSPDREFIQSLFARPVDAVAARLDPVVAKMRSAGSEVIGVHIRRGDYGQAAFYLVPVEWYTALLDRIVKPDSVVFLASDDPAVFAAFEKYNPVTATSLGVQLSNVPIPGCAHLAKDVRERNATALDFFPDWWCLKNCDTVVMPNSTFSFSAAMLSTVCKQAYRSDPDTRQFEQIDPWCAFPSQFIKQRDYQHIPGLYVASNPYW